MFLHYVGSFVLGTERKCGNPMGNPLSLLVVISLPCGMASVLLGVGRVGLVFTVGHGLVLAEYVMEEWNSVLRDIVPPFPPQKS